MADAYSFKGATYCARDIVHVVHTTWHVTHPVGVPTEDYLDRAAQFRGIRRDIPGSFTDQQFPKEVTPAQGQTCLYCQEIIHNE
jgi:hypothetical protein